MCYMCCTCKKIGKTGSECYYVLGKNGQYNPTCSIECAKELQEKIIADLTDIILKIESQEIKKDTW